MDNKIPTTYLDANSTTELSEEAASVLIDMVLGNIYANPSSVHDAGKKVRTIIDASRYGVAESLNCSSGEVYFTGGGTESNNMALRGTFYPPGKLAISAAEHPSVSSTAEFLAGEDNLIELPLTPAGNLDLEAAEELITEEISLVSVMLANNETGVIFPVRELVDLAHQRGVLVHCDAVQAYGKIKVDVKDLGVDMLSISGHKAHALPGVGALYIRKGVQVNPLITGGEQEKALRAGTENYFGIASLGTVANEITRRKGNMEPGLRDAFEMGVLRRIPDVVINGHDQPRVPNTSSITFKGIHSTSMLTALNELGVQASAGPACSSGSAKPSKTLLAMGVSKEDALSTIRFSFSSMSKIMDAARAIEACVRCASTLRQGRVL